MSLFCEFAMFTSFISKSLITLRAIFLYSLNHLTISSSRFMNSSLMRAFSVLISFFCSSLNVLGLLNLSLYILIFNLSSSSLRNLLKNSSLMSLYSSKVKSFNKGALYNFFVSVFNISGIKDGSENLFALSLIRVKISLYRYKHLSFTFFM